MFMNPKIQVIVERLACVQLGTLCASSRWWELVGSKRLSEFS